MRLYIERARIRRLEGHRWTLTSLEKKGLDTRDGFLPLSETDSYLCLCSSLTPQGLVY